MVDYRIGKDVALVNAAAKQYTAGKKVQVDKAGKEMRESWVDDIGAKHTLVTYTDGTQIEAELDKNGYYHVVIENKTHNMAIFIDNGSNNESAKDLRCVNSFNLFDDGKINISSYAGSSQKKSEILCNNDQSHEVNLWKNSLKKSVANKETLKSNMEQYLQWFKGKQ
ncbi:MAG: hypothetical protein QE263_09740 [Vampirovibrionales bacterium]|nr:hypothetical protein [Vampirovibrionales bacterium]